MIKGVDVNAQWGNKAGRDSSGVLGDETIVNATLQFCKCYVILT